MASVKVAIRVRPFNSREINLCAQPIIEIEGKKTRITNLKVKDAKKFGESAREKYRDFTFDYSYWSFDPQDDHFASQEQVFKDFGLDVVGNAFEGYNACIFAYGQTGSGKTHTMMGEPENPGLIPRICEDMFTHMSKGKEKGTTYLTEVSYLEIYNERVKDLLNENQTHSLKVREHNKHGVYVEGLSKHSVMDYGDIQGIMKKGNKKRTTASTNMNDVSSRSHAIFTITFTQAHFIGDKPSQTVSKINLVDLAGSERAAATGATGVRLKESGQINKSLGTLASVISDLAKAAQSKSKNTGHIRYRDSILTRLLQDSLGGNAKTFMIATISPADVNYGETLSTLEYANKAKNIINKPTINEDSDVKLIRDLRAEIKRLKSMLGTTSDSSDPLLVELHEKEAKEKVLTEEWTGKWKEIQKILMEHKDLAFRKSGTGIFLDSEVPHLIGIHDDILSTGVTLYRLKEGETKIGSEDENLGQDIVLAGSGLESNHCTILLSEGIATLKPSDGAACTVDGRKVDKSTRLSQGCVIRLGSNTFRYNDPAEAEKLRREGSPSHLNSSRLSVLSHEHPTASPLASAGESDDKKQDDKMDIDESNPSVLEPMDVDATICDLGKNANVDAGNENTAAEDSVSNDVDVNVTDLLEDPTPKTQQEGSDKKQSEGDVEKTPYKCLQEPGTIPDGSINDGRVGKGEEENAGNSTDAASIVMSSSIEAKSDPSTLLQALGKEDPNHSSYQPFPTTCDQSTGENDDESKTTGKIATKVSVSSADGPERKPSGRENHLSETTEEDTTPKEFNAYPTETVQTDTPMSGIQLKEPAKRYSEGKEAPESSNLHERPAASPDASADESDDKKQGLNSGISHDAPCRDETPPVKPKSKQGDFYHKAGAAQECINRPQSNSDPNYERNEIEDNKIGQPDLANEEHGSVQGPEDEANSRSYHISDHQEATIRKEPAKNAPVQSKEPIAASISKGRGLEWSNNSCYIDSTIFSLFYHEHHFDDWFLEGKHAQDPYNQHVPGRVREKLRSIAKNLHEDKLYSANLVQDLRSVLLPLDSRMGKIMLDVEDFLTILCKKGLNLTPFIRYTAGTANYFHQIFFFSKEIEQDYASVQDLLDKSMDYHKVKFTCVPAPALLLKMPRSKGKLQHCKSVLPNLVLDVSKHCDSQSGEKIRMVLRAVICLQNMHYTTYVRDIKTQAWCHFNDIGPTVKALPGFEKRIDNLASSGRGLRKVDTELQHMTSWAHMCIYLPQSNGGPNT